MLHPDPSNQQGWTQLSKTNNERWVLRHGTATGANT